MSTDGRLHRWLTRLIRGYARLGLVRGGNYPLLLLGSNLGHGRVQWLAVAVLLPVMAFVQYEHTHALHAIGAFEFAPAADHPVAERMGAAHYRDQRSGTARYLAVPFVPAAVSEGPYLDLFIPYSPREWNTHIAAQCPDAAALPSDAEASTPYRERIDCLVELLAPRLDGERIAAAHFLFGEDARSGLPGLRGLIPVQGLTPGRHLLAVRKLSRRREENETAEDWLIPFWR